MMKIRHDPLELIKYFWPDTATDHIVYDPELRRGDYDIVRGCGHDGTLYFTHEMLRDGLLSIAYGISFCKKTEPLDWSRVKQIRYVLGSIRHVAVFEMVNLRCGLYPGLRERIRMPVKCEYVN